MNNEELHGVFGLRQLDVLSTRRAAFREYNTLATLTPDTTENVL